MYHSLLVLVWSCQPPRSANSFKPTSFLKLPLDPRHDIGLNLVIVHALQCVKSNRLCSVFCTPPHESTDAQYLELLSLARRILDLTNKTLSNPEKAVELIFCLVDVLLFPPEAWQGQLTGEAGPKMRILGGSDVQDIAIDANVEA
jgi:hypothetical protein